MRSQNALLLCERAGMPRIGLRHLKTHASQVLRDVEDNRARYVITNRGEPVAVIIPFATADEVEPKTKERSWEEFLRLREKIGKSVTQPFSAEALLRELRR
jgi:prevent-host-death family protein